MCDLAARLLRLAPLADAPFVLPGALWARLGCDAAVVFVEGGQGDGERRLIPGAGGALHIFKHVDTLQELADPGFECGDHRGLVHLSPSLGGVVR
jgi:hypothetical protein